MVHILFLKYFNSLYLGSVGKWVCDITACIYPYILALFCALSTPQTDFTQNNVL